MSDKKNNRNKSTKPLSLAKVNDATQQLIHGETVRHVANSLNISVGSAINIRNKNKENIPPRKKGARNKISSKTREVLARHL
ncbi:hypothetical protein BGZ76_008207, partial [Entomortierella beljakovae]